jgi:hypothetical protein
MAEPQPKEVGRFRFVNKSAKGTRYASSSFQNDVLWGWAVQWQAQKVPWVSGWRRCGAGTLGEANVVFV